MASNTGHFGIMVGAKDAASGIFQKISGSLTGMGAGAGRVLGTMTRKLTITTNAVSNMDVAMGLARRQTLNLIPVFKKLALGAVAVWAGIKGLALGFRAAGAAGNFEEGLARVGAISRATAGEMKLLKDAAIQAGIATQFSPDEAVQGLQNLAAMGFNAQKSIEVLLPTLDLAAGGMIGVAEATSTMTSALNIFGLKSKDAGITADRLLRITQLTALQADDLQLALANVSKGAGAAKQSLGEMLVVMGLVKNAGLDVSMTATSTSQALIQMAQRADKFSKLGIRIEDAQGKFRPFADIVLDTQKAISGLTGDVAQAAKITELFGIRGQAAFVNVSKAITEGVTDSSGKILKGAAALAFMRKQIEDAEGTSREFREIMNSTWNGIKRLIVGSVSTIKIVLGDKFIPIFKVIGIVVKHAFIILLDILQAIPTPVLVAVAAFTTLASALLVYKGILLILSALNLIAVASFGALKAAAISTAVAMWAAYWPVLLILGLIAAAVAVLFAIFGKKTPAGLSQQRAVQQAQTAGASGPAGGLGVGAQTAPLEALGARTSSRAPRIGEIQAREAAAGRRERRLMDSPRPVEAVIHQRIDLDGRRVARNTSRHFLDEKRARRTPDHLKETG